MDGSVLSAVLDQVSNVTTEGRKVVRKALPGGRSEILIIFLPELKWFLQYFCHCGWSQEGERGAYSYIVL